MQRLGPAAKAEIRRSGGQQQADFPLACPLQDLHAGREVLERDPEIEHQDALILPRAPSLARAQ